jgi:hypothetical protein
MSYESTIIDTHYDDIPTERYVTLWKHTKKCLAEYVNKMENPLRKEDKDVPEPHKDTCIERMVRLVSSGDKADQMKARRDHTIVYVTNPMVN